MVATLVLSGERGRRLAIEVRGYERDVARDPSDANWLDCSVDLVLGRFQGSAEASFATEDFACFFAELEAVMRGSGRAAVFETMEEGLSVRVELSRGGRVTVAGQLREVEVDGSVLSYSFESDRSSIEEFQVMLGRVVSEFPARVGARQP